MVVFKEKMRVGPKGQVVIPQEFRKKLNIKPGSAVIVGYTDHGLGIAKMIEERWKKATKST